MCALQCLKVLTRQGKKLLELQCEALCKGPVPSNRGGARGQAGAVREPAARRDHLGGQQGCRCRCRGGVMGPLEPLEPLGPLEGVWHLKV